MGQPPSGTVPLLLPLDVPELPPEVPLLPPDVPLLPPEVPLLPPEVPLLPPDVPLLPPLLLPDEPPSSPVCMFTTLPLPLLQAAATTSATSAEPFSAKARCDPRRRPMLLSPDSIELGVPGLGSAVHSPRR
jgi:hypothetical protein